MILLKNLTYCYALPLLVAAAPAWAINKCTGKDGKVVYQEMACEPAAQGQSVRVFAGQGESPARPVPPARTPIEQRAAPAEPAAERQPNRGAASLGPQEGASTDDLVAQCLNWYRPRLKNPAGAYADGVSRSGSVLTMTIYASNSFGGYVPKDAACEIKNGSIDHGWTKIQAERAGWR